MGYPCCSGGDGLLEKPLDLRSAVCFGERKRMALPWSPLPYPSSLTQIHRLNASHSEPSRKWAGLQVSKANLTGQGAQAARRGRNSGNRNGRRVSNWHDLIKTIFKTKGKNRSPTSSYPHHPSPTQFAFRSTAFRQHSDTRRFFFSGAGLEFQTPSIALLGLGRGVASKSNLQTYLIILLSVSG